MAQCLFCGSVLARRREEEQEDVRLRVMRLIDRNAEMSSRQIADNIKISNGSAYYVLTALVEKGFVKLENFRSSARKGRYGSLLTPKGIREKSLLTHRFIGRKRQEFEALRAEIATLEEEAGMSIEMGSSEGRIE